MNLNNNIISNKEVVVIVDDSKYMKNHPYCNDTYRATMDSLQGYTIDGIDDWSQFDRINCTVVLINDDIRYLVKPTDTSILIKREDFKKTGRSKLIDGVFEVVKDMKEYEKTLPSNFFNTFQYVIIADGIDDSSKHSVDEYRHLMRNDENDDTFDLVYIGTYPSNIRKV